MGGGMVMKTEDTPSDSHLKRGRGEGRWCGENTSHLKRGRGKGGGVVSED